MAPTPPGDRPLLDGRYALGDPLGSGGMGEVLDGWDTRLGRPVAVKVLRAEMAAIPQVRARFAREARMAARLSSPRVVAVYDTGDDGGLPYLVMERLSGRTLGDELDAGPMDPAVVRTVGLQVLEALGAAHAVGMVHRDIKPSNVLVAGPGEWKVADFGIAKADEATETSDPSLTSIGMVVGTAAYLSPERFLGQPADPSSDLYALGVVLYEALAGSRRREAGALVPRRPPLATVRPDLPADLVDLVQRAISPDAEQRFTSAAAMAEALARTSPTGAGPTAGAAGVGAAPGAAAGAPTIVLAANQGRAAASEPHTEVLAAAAPLAPAVDPDGAGPAPRRRRTAAIAGVGAAVVAAVVAVAVLLASHHSSTPSPPATSTSTSVPAGPATTGALPGAGATSSTAQATTSTTETTTTSTTATTSATTSATTVAPSTSVSATTTPPTTASQATTAPPQETTAPPSATTAPPSGGAPSTAAG